MSASSGALWHGRFEGGPAEALLAYTESLSYDQRLAQHDIQGSRAHVRGLHRSGLLEDDELKSILSALDTAAMELSTDQLAFVASDEDIHTAIERRVTELTGDAGAKIHTGRSRNDQVATAMRLWTKDALRSVAGDVITLQQVLLTRAQGAGGAYLPGYTHLQRAQPVLLAHHLAAHAWALGRDVDRLFDARRRTDISPLGAGALAGTSLPLDPAAVADDLGFDRAFTNSLDATSDRDFVAEGLFALVMVGIHLSRIGEEVVLWSSEEFGFLGLDDAYATGSSMMPQKKNPDIAELARGKAGRLIGNLTGLLATLKSLPLAYNRDLQEDKEPLFDAVDQVSLALGALGGLLEAATFNIDNMAAAADSDGPLATDLAEILVVGGMPFRQAHAVVGALVRQSLDKGTPLVEVAAANEHFGEDVRSLFEPGAGVTRRRSPGGGGPGPVADQLVGLAAQIEANLARLDD
ncbi:MAG: argininosuccinate lyase [Actinomycetia bacterium]|nr:argininosuccinate lyase [Actinomycetes bacterium]